MMARCRIWGCLYLILGQLSIILALLQGHAPLHNVPRLLPRNTEGRPQVNVTRVIPSASGPTAYNGSNAWHSISATGSRRAPTSIQHEPQEFNATSNFSAQSSARETDATASGHGARSGNFSRSPFDLPIDSNSTKPAQFQVNASGGSSGTEHSVNSHGTRSDEPRTLGNTPGNITERPPYPTAPASRPSVGLSESARPSWFNRGPWHDDGTSARPHHERPSMGASVNSMEVNITKPTSSGRSGWIAGGLWHSAENLTQFGSEGSPLNEASHSLGAISKRPTPTNQSGWTTGVRWQGAENFTHTQSEDFSDSGSIYPPKASIERPTPIGRAAWVTGGPWQNTENHTEFVADQVSDGTGRHVYKSGGLLTSTPTRTLPSWNTTHSEPTGAGASFNFTRLFAGSHSGNAGQSLNTSSNSTEFGSAGSNGSDIFSNNTISGTSWAGKFWNESGSVSVQRKSNDSIFGSSFAGSFWNDTGLSSYKAEYKPTSDNGPVNVPDSILQRVHDEPCNGTSTYGYTATVVETQFEYVDAYYTMQNTTTISASTVETGIPACFELFSTTKGANGKDGKLQFAALPETYVTSTLLVQKLKSAESGDAPVNRLFSGPQVEAQPAMGEPASAAAQKTSATPNGNEMPTPMFTQLDIPAATQPSQPNSEGTSNSDQGSSGQSHIESSPQSNDQPSVESSEPHTPEGSSPTQEAQRSPTHDAVPAMFAEQYFKPSVERPSNQQPSNQQPSESQPGSFQNKEGHQQQSSPAKQFSTQFFGGKLPGSDSGTSSPGKESSGSSSSEGSSSSVDSGSSSRSGSSSVSGTSGGASSLGNTGSSGNAGSSGTAGLAAGEGSSSAGSSSAGSSGSSGGETSAQAHGSGQSSGSTGSAFFGSSSNDQGHGDTGGSGGTSSQSSTEGHGSTGEGILSNIFGSGSQSTSEKAQPGTNGGSTSGSQATPADSGDGSTNTEKLGHTGAAGVAGLFGSSGSSAGSGSSASEGQTSPNQGFAQSYFGASTGAGSSSQPESDSKGSQIQPIFPLPGARPQNNPSVSTNIGGTPVKLGTQNVVIGTQTFSRGTSPTSAVVGGQTFDWDANTFAGPSANLSFPQQNARSPSVVVGGENFAVHQESVDFAGKTIRRPAKPSPSPFEANSQIFYINPSQIISPETDIGFIPTTTPKPFTYDGDTLSADASYLFAGSTSIPIPDSGIVEYKGKKLDVESNKIIAPETTIPLTPSQTYSDITLGSLTISVAPSGAILGNLDIKNIQSGMKPIITTLAGQRVEIGPSGIEVGSTTTIPYPTAPPITTSPIPFRVIDCGHLSVTVSGTTAIVDGRTFTCPPGSPTTSTVISNRILEIGPSGVHFDATTVDLPTITPETTAQAISVGASEAVIGGKTYPVGPGATSQTVYVGGEIVTVGPEGVIVPAVTLGNGIVVPASTIAPDVTATSTGGGFTTVTGDIAMPGAGGVSGASPAPSGGVSPSPLPGNGGERRKIWNIYPILLLLVTIFVGW